MAGVAGMPMKFPREISIEGFRRIQKFDGFLVFESYRELDSSFRGCVNLGKLAAIHCRLHTRARRNKDQPSL